MSQANLAVSPQEGIRTRQPEAAGAEGPEGSQPTAAQQKAEAAIHEAMQRNQQQPSPVGRDYTESSSQRRSLGNERDSRAELAELAARRGAESGETSSSVFSFVYKFLKENLGTVAKLGATAGLGLLGASMLPSAASTVSAITPVLSGITLSGIGDTLGGLTTGALENIDMAELSNLQETAGDALEFGSDLAGDIVDEYGFESS
jgi:hypothetical protein